MRNLHGATPTAAVDRDIIRHATRRGRRGFGDGRSRWPLTALVTALLLVTTFAPRPAVATGSPIAGDWSQTAPNGNYNDATATLLPNGKVLYAGGEDWMFSILHASAQIYDPTTASWTATASLHVARTQHTATLLPSGKVLVAGGSVCCGPRGSYIPDGSAELYDPAAGTWTVTGSMNTARSGHSATLLPDGKVLVTGGTGPFGALASAELYDPATGLWTPTGSMATTRIRQTATLLPTGKVLVVGGEGPNGALASAELYDPASGGWSTAATPGVAREEHTATLLASGQVLVAGGYTCTSPSGCYCVTVLGCVCPLTCTFLASAALYYPRLNVWRPIASMTTPRTDHTATLLRTGQVLMASGYGSYESSLPRAEVYDPSTGTWTPTGSMDDSTDHTATLLPNGQVLVVGGFFCNDGGNCGSDNVVQLYTPTVLAVNPTGGSSGQTVTATGWHFQANESVALQWDSLASTPVYTATADATGAITAPVTVPPLGAGVHELMAVGASSNRMGSARFRIH